ncbi:MAG: serine/threonine protein kinase [Planctomycetes bacterium]|nr:serine/threonine protein kinase [Planctomycetota bacterium]
MSDLLSGDLPHVKGYNVVGKLNQGGFSDIFKVKDTKSGDFYAVKMLSDRGVKSTVGMSSLRNEYAVLSKIKSPYYCRVKELNVDAPKAYLVMEFIEGCSLRHWLMSLKEQGQRYGIIDAVNLVQEIAQGLHVIHSKGLVHKDLKPENLLLRGKDVKIIDLAFTESFGGFFAKKTKFEGTPQYAAPELIKEQKIDNRTDIYALGIILFELVTGRVPFNEKIVADVLKAQIGNRPPSACKLNPELSKKWDKLFETVLAKSPDARPKDVGVLINLLRHTA